MLAAKHETALRFFFGRGESAFEGSYFGAQLDKLQLYGGALKKPAKRDRAGKLVRDEDLEEARRQWLSLRTRCKAYVLGRETLVVLMAQVLLERPWKLLELPEDARDKLHRVSAVYLELDRLYAGYEAGELPNEDGLRRWLKTEVLPIGAGNTAPDITARPTAETTSSNAQEPSRRDLIRAGAASRRLRAMAAAGKQAECAALELYYGLAGDAFERADQPRVYSVLLAVNAGRALDAKAPRTKAALSEVDRMIGHCSRRDTDAYDAVRELFAAAETQAERLYASACRAYADRDAEREDARASGG